jgi:histidine triad (HIT) family protein
MPEQPQEKMSEEQMKELQEKVKNMSPEELREFQKKQCIFCHIISGKVQSKKIYEDDQSVAVLDINPANPGHILLLPKEHYSIMPQLSDEEIAHLFTVAKTLSNAALRGLGVQGTNIMVQNGVAAGQKAQHFMIHIIPRKEKDGLDFELPQKEIPEADLEVIRKKLEAKLGKVEGSGKAPPNVQDLIQPKEQVVDAEFEEQESVKGEKIDQEVPEQTNPESDPETKPETDQETKPETKRGAEPAKSKKTPDTSKSANQKPTKSSSKKSTKDTTEEESEISLDDISNLLGGK